jgi:hypothetical protein
MTGIDPSLHPPSPPPPPPISLFILPFLSPFPRVIAPILSSRSSRSSLSGNPHSTHPLRSAFCSAFARSLRWPLFVLCATEGPRSLMQHARGTDPVVSACLVAALTHTLCPLCHRSAHCRLRDRPLEPVARARRSDPFRDPLIGFGSASREGSDTRGCS